MAQLNHLEQAYVQQYEDLVAKRARGEFVTDGQIAAAERIADNQRRNAELEALAAKDSHNSSRPPSTVQPGAA